MAAQALTFTLDQMVNQHRLNRESDFAIKRQHILLQPVRGPAD
jgi:hypothetical protein